jgi:hypothetical protein
MTRAFTTFAALACVAVVAAPLSAGAECRRVHGTQDEVPVSGPACTSPVGLCTLAQISGSLKGEAAFTATSILPSADTPTTGVVFVTGDTEMTAVQLGSRGGTLLIKDAAAYRTTGDFDLVDLQTIVGGTGDFAGASGTLRISGHFAPQTGGTTDYEGTICLP